MQSVLTIPRFWICEFVYLLKFTTHESIAVALSQPFTDYTHAQSHKKMSPSIYMFQDEVKQDNTQLSFSLQSVNKGPFHGLFSAMFFCIFIGDFII